MRRRGRCCRCSPPQASYPSMPDTFLSYLLLPAPFLKLNIEYMFEKILYTFSKNVIYYYSGI